MFVTVAPFLRHVSGVFTVTVAVARSHVALDPAGSQSGHIVKSVVDVQAEVLEQIVPAGGLLGSAQNVTSLLTPPSVNVPWPIAVFVVSAVTLLSVHVNVKIS